jgi:hypothetical protein
MKPSLTWLTVIALAFVVACSTKPVPPASIETVAAPVSIADSATRETASASAPLLNYKTTFDLADYKGSTYLSFMKLKVKPALDQYANEGFTVANSSAVRAALRNVSKKVASGALRGAGGEANLLKIADILSKQGDVTFNELPQRIVKTGLLPKQVNPRTGKTKDARYDLTTFFGLVSGGGVAVKIDRGNAHYDVNYGTGKAENDEMTGRSFGEAPDRLASDASDKEYLDALEEYVRGENPTDLYRSILEVLVNCDNRTYSKMSNLGQAVASDFLAVYTAEQDRHMMSDLRRFNWDEALLEVTLLSAFHSGQDRIKVMYKGQLTDTTYKQAPAARPSNEKKPAALNDYWQSRTTPTILAAESTSLASNFAPWERRFQSTKGITIGPSMIGLSVTSKAFERPETSSPICRLI